MLFLVNQLFKIYFKVGFCVGASSAPWASSFCLCPRTPSPCQSLWHCRALTLTRPYSV